MFALLFSVRPTFKIAASAMFVVLGACGPRVLPEAYLEGACHYDAYCAQWCAQAETLEAKEHCDTLQYEAAKKHEAHTRPPRRTTQRGKRRVPVVGQSAATLTPSQIASRCMGAVVTVKASKSLGSGFGVTDEGWVVTNLHVVAGEKDIKVVLADGKERPATAVIAYDDKHDLALLRVSGMPMALSVGESAEVGLGDEVVVIGNPLGLQSTVSNGIVSGGRQFEKDFEVLQITAPIAPGSSGGPLIDAHGQVIGVVVATFRGGQNLNFAVPAHYLRELLMAALKQNDPSTLEAFAAETKAFAEPPPPADGPAPAAPVPAPATASEDTGRIVDGCTQADRKLVEQVVGEAVDAARPLCDAKRFGPCRQLLWGASADLETKLSAGCKGPKGMLIGGRATAESGDSAAQAKAMRALFDALLATFKGAAGRAKAKP
ncbi:S1C family serine protease [Polyangium aurulentum]|uniref:S1C family serine protease n=1 Tax=Polyangium aurulentum TaxID=2567896 RepID=UPI0010AE3F91|nr:S1C family serine protease [Polyangium aurulentum]UQA58077.1 S1C family serine protease [Polyangium aurulentum]